MTRIDLNETRVLNLDPNTIQQINLTGNLGQDRNTAICFIVEEVKGTVTGFPEKTVSVL